MIAGAISLSDLLRANQGGHDPDARNDDYAATTLPEAQSAELKAYLDRYQAENPFKRGDLVTPVASSNLRGVGAMHIVLDTMDPTFNFAAGDDKGSSAFGARYTTRVAIIMKRGTIASFWMDHVDLEPYRGDR